MAPFFLLSPVSLSLSLHLLFAFWSQRADSRMSANLMVPLLLLYINRLHCCGWNSAAVITSVSSSMLAGLISTISRINVGEWEWFDDRETILAY